MRDHPQIKTKGKYTYGNPKIHGGKSFVYFGNFCSISDFATFDCGFQHPTDLISTYPFNQKFPEMEGCNDLHPKTNGDIIVGNDVWIADGAVIMSGVTIGNGAVIGLNSVVTKDVPAYAVMCESPAIAKKFRMLPYQIKAMEEIAWWNWDDEKIKEAVPMIMSNRIDEFIKKYQPVQTSETITSPK